MAVPSSWGQPYLRQRLKVQEKKLVRLWGTLLIRDVEAWPFIPDAKPLTLFMAFGGLSNDPFGFSMMERMQPGAQKAG